MMKYMKKSLMLILLVSFFSHAGEAGSVKIDNLYSIEYLNSNLSIVNGKKVRVYGYVKSGFDGFHVVCSISLSADEITAIEQIVWLSYPSCYDKTQEYKEAYAEISGRFNSNDGDVYISGGLYRSTIDVEDIKWQHGKKK